MGTNNVRKIRVALGWSQGKVAQLSGGALYTMRVSLIERDQVKVRPEEKLMLAGILSQPVDYLFPSLPARTPVAP